MSARVDSILRMLDGLESDCCGAPVLLGGVATDFGCCECGRDCNAVETTPAAE